MAAGRAGGRDDPGRRSDQAGSESREALERSSGFSSGTTDPDRAERKTGAAFRGTEKTGAGKSGSQRGSGEGQGEKRESASGPGDTEDPPGRGNRSSGRDENPGGRGPEEEKRSGGPEPSDSGGSGQTGKAGERSEIVRREKRRGCSCPEQSEGNRQGTGGCPGGIPALAGAGQKKRRKREKRKGAGTAPWPTGNRK